MAHSRQISHLISTNIRAYFFVAKHSVYGTDKNTSDIAMATTHTHPHKIINMQLEKVKYENSDKACEKR